VVNIVRDVGLVIVVILIHQMKTKGPYLSNTAPPSSPPLAERMTRARRAVMARARGAENATGDARMETLLLAIILLDYEQIKPRIECRLRYGKSGKKFIRSKG
jgi:hypothetical protein